MLWPPVVEGRIEKRRYKRSRVCKGSFPSKKSTLDAGGFLSPSGGPKKRTESLTKCSWLLFWKNKVGGVDTYCPCFLELVHRD